MPNNAEPSLGAIRAADYGTPEAPRPVVESFDYHGQRAPFWAVPAWDECGASELCGPFASMAEAERAVADYLAECDAANAAEPAWQRRERLAAIYWDL